MYQPYRPPQQRTQTPGQAPTGGGAPRPAAPPPPRPPQAIRAAAPAPAPNFQQRAAMPAARQPQPYQTSPHAFRGETLAPAIESFARQGLKAPSRFDAKLVRQGIDVANRDLMAKRTEGMRGIEEMASRRGIVGSSTELDTVRNLERDLQDVHAKRLLELNLEQARTYATDRGLAGTQALQTAELGRSLGADREMANRYAAEFDRTTGRDREDDERFRADLGLETAGRENAAAMERALFDLQAGQQHFNQQLQGADFTENADRFRAQFGEDQYRYDANQDLDYEKLGESSRQFGATLDENGRQFNDTLGENYRQFNANLGQRNTEYWQDIEERRADRSTQDSQFGRSLGEQQRQFDTSTGENRRQFDANLGQRSLEFGETLGENRRQFDTTTGEDRRRFDTTFGEERRRFDTTFGENQRQFDTTAGENRRQFDTSFGENRRQFDSTMGLSRDELALRGELGRGDLDVRRDEASMRSNQDVINMILGLLPYVKAGLPGGGGGPVDRRPTPGGGGGGGDPTGGATVIGGRPGGGGAGGADPRRGDPRGGRGEGDNREAQESLLPAAPALAPYEMSTSIQSWAPDTTGMEPGSPEWFDAYDVASRKAVRDGTISHRDSWEQMRDIAQQYHQWASARGRREFTDGAGNFRYPSPQEIARGALTRGEGMSGYNLETHGDGSVARWLIENNFADAAKLDPAMVEFMRNNPNASTDDWGFSQQYRQHVDPAWRQEQGLRPNATQGREVDIGNQYGSPVIYWAATEGDDTFTLADGRRVRVPKGGGEHIVNRMGDR